MVLYKGFGQQLRDARIAHGLTYETVSRNLRIRIDILKAIEEEDFSAIPPNPYARGMIHAYAKQVGLNADNITSAFNDALDAYENQQRGIKNGRRALNNNGYARSLPPSLSGQISSKDLNTFYQEDSREAARERLRRRREQRGGNAAPSQGESTGRSVRQTTTRGTTRGTTQGTAYGTARCTTQGTAYGTTRGTASPHKASNFIANTANSIAHSVGSAFPSHKKIDINHSIYSDMKKGRNAPRTRTQGSFVSMNKQKSIMSSQSYGINAKQFGGNKVLIIGIVVIVLLLIIAANFLFAKPAPTSSNSSANTSSSSSVAISGLTDPGSAGTVEQENVVVPIAPTAAVFTYSIADGEDCYYEIYIDDEESPSDAGTYTGPKRGTYDVTGTLSFMTSRPSAVTLKVDGKEVEMSDGDGDGIYIYIVDFYQILETWKEENGQA